MGGKFFFWCFIVLAIFSCTQTSKKSKQKTLKRNVVVKISQKDTLIWSRVFLQSDKTNCKTKNDCNYVELFYPIFKNRPRLNSSIRDYILRWLNVEKENQGSISNFFKSFSQDFLSDTTDATPENTNTSTLSLHIQPVMQDSAVVLIDFLDEMSGGAHPNSNHYYLNWNAKTDKIITLDNLMVNGYKKRFLIIAENIFRKNENLTSKASLENYNFDKGFSLNNNFKITAKGICFFYNTYEIQAYSFGPTELLIPYSKIKSLLKPNTILAQYIK